MTPQTVSSSPASHGASTLSRVSSPMALRWMASHPALALQILAISSMHYLTPVTLHAFHFHAIYQRMYYLPILLAAWRFGFRWTLFYALLCGVGYAPHIAFQWPSESFESFTQYVEIGLFFGVGGITGWLFDISNRQNALLLNQADRLRRADRLALMGSLAGGLAHEIRNPLQSLLGAADILKRDLGPQHPDHEFADILERELHRVNRILNEFLEYARPRPPDRMAMGFDEVLAGALSTLASEFSKQGITIQKEVPDPLPKVFVDAGQIQQVLLNLLFNARDAMPQGGAVHISALATEGVLRVTLGDQGPGILPETRPHLFEPFHTTKPKGTGLGLALSRAILEAHGGTLNCLESNPGFAPGFNGAQFELALPLLVEANRLSQEQPL